MRHTLMERFVPEIKINSHTSIPTQTHTDASISVSLLPLNCLIVESQRTVAPATWRVKKYGQNGEKRKEI